MAYDSIADYMSASASNARKVSLNSDGSNTVVNEGDTKAFKKADDSMGKEQFMNLLIAQLKYQDPLNPADDTQFVSQLAQFSQLEFTQNSTQAISSLASNMQAFMELQSLQAQSITNASATPLLGKEVRVMENSFEYKGYSTKELNIHLVDTKEGVVLIKDEDGKVVAELGVAVESSKGGDATVSWDGKDADGKSFLGGKYSIEVVDSGIGSKNVGYAFQDGVVTGVNFSSSGAALTVNGTQFGLGFLVNVENNNSSDSENPGNTSKPTNVSDEVISKIAAIMSGKDSNDAVEKIAEVLGLDEEDRAVSDIVEILNRNILDEDIIKKLAEFLGQKDSDYAEMIKRVKAVLGLA
jgi:flagellar basal-body rod modification protein FlgD